MVEYFSLDKKGERAEFLWKTCSKGIKGSQSFSNKHIKKEVVKRQINSAEVREHQLTS
jgi:hypothetical protein